MAIGSESEQLDESDWGLGMTVISQLKGEGGWLSYMATAGMSSVWWTVCLLDLGNSQFNNQAAVTPLFW